MLGDRGQWFEGLTLVMAFHHCSPPWGVPPSEKPVVMLPNRADASPCAADEVACDSGDCIAAELACDFADTCTDGSDEKRCGESQGRHLHQYPSSGGDQALLGWHGQGT